MPFDYNDARLLDSVAYDLVLGDYPRGLNRAKIQSLANGVPPFSEQEVADNQIEVNYNTLTMTRRLHDARSQMANGLLKPGNQFICRTDMGPVHKRQGYSEIVTKEVNRFMKRSPKYFEAVRAKIGSLVLHGISPAAWEHPDWWCQRPLGVEDVLIPSGTYLGFENLPIFMLRRSFTAVELQRLTGPGADPGWRKNMVQRCIAWIDKEMTQLRNTNWPEVWAPEKKEERTKEDGGFYYGDQVPTIDCFDVYGYVPADDSKKKEAGWVRRVILDSWGTPSQQGVGYSMARKSDDLFKNGKSDFLYSSGARPVARNWQEIISFQYADLSAVFPARYHSVRSMGFLLYSMCHMDNRMRCKFQEAVLEALMPYFEVDSMDDAQRALKLNLINRGFIDKTIRPVKAQDRWQVNAQLVELGLQQNSEQISDSSGAFSQRRDFSSDKVEKTRFQVMAELQADTAMIGASLSQAYFYQVFEYRENFRRFLKKGTSDPDAQRFQANVLRQGVPMKLLVPEAWDVEPERTMGGGNKTMELTIAQELMDKRPSFNAKAQDNILRRWAMALTSDVELSRELVPEEEVVSRVVHDTELVFAAIMSGVEITPEADINPTEVAVTMLRKMTQKMQEIAQSGGVGTPQDLQRMNLAVKYTGFYLKVMQGDETEKPIVKALGKALANIVNELKAMAQRQAEQMKKAQAAQAQGNGQMDPKDQAKIQATVATAKTKQDLAKQSHAQKTAQRQIQFEQDFKQKEAENQLKLVHESREHAANLEKTDLEAASNIKRNRLKSTEE